jgi:hypothetical protein
LVLGYCVVGWQHFSALSFYPSRVVSSVVLWVRTFQSRFCLVIWILRLDLELEGS